MRVNPHQKTILKFPVNHLLVIDDDNITDFIVDGVIQNFSKINKCKFETDGWKALEYLSNCACNATFPDLIILDLKMPLMSGNEFLQRYEHLFHRKYPNTKLVVVSNYSAVFKEEINHYYSVDLFLNKPLNREKFQMIQSVFTK